MNEAMEVAEDDPMMADEEPMYEENDEEASRGEPEDENHQHQAEDENDDGAESSLEDDYGDDESFGDEDGSEFASYFHPAPSTPVVKKEPTKVFLSLNNDDEASKIKRDQIQKATIHANGNMDLLLLDGSTKRVFPRTMKYAKCGPGEYDLKEGGSVISAYDHAECTFLRCCGTGEAARMVIQHGMEELSSLVRNLALYQLLSSKEEAEADRRNDHKDSVEIYIAAGMFQGCRNLRELEFADLARVKLGHRFCQDCAALVSVKLPSGLKRIPEKAFLGCHMISTMEWPASLEIICDDAFRDCSLSGTVDFPPPLYDIGCRAFKNCPLQVVKLPSGFKTFKKEAFDPTLKNMVIPDTMQNMRRLMFNKSSCHFGIPNYDDDEFFESEDGFCLSVDLIHVWLSSFETFGYYKMSLDELSFEDMDFTMHSNYQNFFYRLMDCRYLKALHFRECKFDTPQLLQMLKSLEGRSNLRLGFPGCSLSESESTAYFLNAIMKPLLRLDLCSLTDILGADFAFKGQDDYQVLFTPDADLDVWIDVLHSQRGAWSRNITQVQFQGFEIPQHQQESFNRILLQFITTLQSKPCTITMKCCQLNLSSLCTSLKSLKVQDFKCSEKKKLNLEDCWYHDDDVHQSVFFDALAPLGLSGNLDRSGIVCHNDGTINLHISATACRLESLAHWILNECSMKIYGIFCYDARSADEGSVEELDIFLATVLHQVETLNFEGCQLSFDDLPKLAKTIKEQKHLTDFTIGNSTLTGLHSSGVLEDLLKFHKLSNLELTGVRVTEEIFETLLCALKRNHPTLTSLCLGDCGLSNEKAASILLALENNESLSSLDFSGNPLTCDSSWISGLADLKKLRDVKLPWSCAQFFAKGANPFDVEADELDLNDTWWEPVYRNWSLFSIQVDEEFPVPNMMKLCFERNRDLDVVTSGDLDHDFPMVAAPNLLSSVCFLDPETSIYAFLKRYITHLLPLRSSQINKKRRAKIESTIWQGRLRSRK